MRSSLGRYSAFSTPLMRFLVPLSFMIRPRRGSSALSICAMLAFGFCASRKAWSTVVPATRPLVGVTAPAGTVAGTVQLPPPVLLRLAAVSCVALRFALVRPTVS